MYYMYCMYVHILSEYISLFVHTYILHMMRAEVRSSLLYSTPYKALGSDVIQKPSIATTTAATTASQHVLSLVQPPMNADNIDASALRMHSSNVCINNSVTSKATEVRRLYIQVKVFDEAYFIICISICDITGDANTGGVEEST